MPFTVEVFESIESDNRRRNLTASEVATPGLTKANPAIEASQTTPIPLLPASYRTNKHNTEVLSRESITYVSHELSVKRLNGIHEWLRIVGRPMPPRALHRQKMMSRDKEQMDLHLVWSEKRYSSSLFRVFSSIPDTGRTTCYASLAATATGPSLGRKNGMERTLQPVIDASSMDVH